MAPAGVTHAVTRLVDAASPAIDDAAQVVNDIVGSARPLPGPVGDAHDGALRVTILVDKPDDWDGHQMVARFREHGVQTALRSVRDLEVDPAAGRYAVGGQVQPRPDLVIPYHTVFDDDGVSTLKALEAMDIPLLTSSHGVEASRDKGITARILAEHGITHPPTIEVDHHSQVRAAVEELARPGVPIFFKNPIGSQGIGVAGISNKEEAISVGELVTAHGGRRLLVQGGVQLAPGTPRHDTRHFLIDGKVVASMDRFNADDQLRGGLSSGGSGATATDVPPGEIEMVERAAAAVGLRNVAGVDVFGGNLLELNYGPGQKMGPITGIDVTGALVDHATRLAAASRSARA